MKVSKQIITFFLAFAMLFSLFTFASASAPSGVMVDNSSVTAWNALISGNVKSGVSVSDAQSAYWSVINSAMSKYGVGDLGSYDKVVQVTSRLDSSGSGALGSLGELLVDSFTILWSASDYVVMYDNSLGVYRPYDNKALAWVVNSLGHFPYYDPAPDGSSGTDTPTVERTGQWVEMSKINSNTVLWHVVGNYELNEFMVQWSDVYSNIRRQETDNYFWLTVTVGTRPLVLCDKYGYPYYLPKDKKTAVTTPQNYYQDTTNNYIDDSTTNNYYDYENNEYNQYDNSTNVNVMDGGSALVGSPIDINNGIINVGGELQYIDNLTYDASTQSYYVDSHDAFTYNEITNNYTTNYYSYSVQYHINYTSITYIGQTEEYDKRYEMYYELPDGRSSADLTAEDLEQLSTVFVDVVQYARSADDLNQRVLYHFDGNTEDSSYWSYCTSFDWDAGASLTYMDEGTFNGSLYLDETEHDFTITLPSNDAASDFTLQFRYYQSYTAVPKQDSYIQIGEDVIFQFTGSAYLTGSGSTIAATSIGSWNELCFMKQDGVLHYYINGVYYGSVADNNYHANTIRFYFGSTQQTYKKLDELRFTKAAIFTAGEDYICSSVPFDSNLSLVLPDSYIPVADEVMVLTPSVNNLLTEIGLDDWTNGLPSVKSIGAHSQTYTPYASDANKYSDEFGSGFSLFYRSSYTVLSAGNGAVSFSSSTSSSNIRKELSSNRYYDSVGGGFFIPCTEVNQVLNYSTGSVQSEDSSSFYWGNDGDVYTLSVVCADGTSSVCTFKVNLNGVSVIDSVQSSAVLIDACTLVDRVQYSEVFTHPLTGSSSLIQGSWQLNCYGLSLLPVDDTEIIYMELVEGSEPQFSIDWEQAVYSSGELEESPVLAVRTNRPIAGYQIGGVRPSYPTTGLVYAMVENSRIISLQQYTGFAWEEVDGRIWTGERWIPYSSFDVFTLQDFYDIIGGSGDDYEYIYTESGFWAWWQKQWKEFTSTLFGLLEKILKAASGGGGDLSISIENNTIIDDEDKEPFNPDVYRGVIKTIRRSLDFLFGFFDSASGGLNDFLDQFDDTNSVFYGLFNLPGLGG